MNKDDLEGETENQRHTKEFQEGALFGVGPPSGRTDFRNELDHPCGARGLGGALALESED